jgi:hypothetical protein
MHPEKVQAFIIQNGNAYDEGLGEFWNPIKDWWNNKTPENEKKLLSCDSRDNKVAIY